MIQIAEDIVAFAVRKNISDPVDFLKKTFRPDFEPATLYKDERAHVIRAEVNTDVFYQFDEYIKFKSRKVTPETLKIFKMTKDCLQAFVTHIGKPITFQSFTANFFANLIDFLTEEVQFSYRKGNRMITEVKPKYEWITSHTARRSFCTNEFLAGMAVE